MQVKDQARRLTQLEEMLKEAQLRPVARRRCMEGEDDGGTGLERQVNSITQELQVSALGSIKPAHHQRHCPERSPGPLDDWLASS